MKFKVLCLFSLILIVCSSFYNLMFLVSHCRIVVGLFYKCFYKSMDFTLSGYLL